MDTIYVNGAERTVSLDIPVTTSPTNDSTEVYDGDELVFAPSTINFADGHLSFNLPFALVQYDRNLEIRWQFNYVEDSQTYEYKNSTYVEVVTPILQLNDISEILYEDSDEEPDADEVADLEKAVRHVIQAHTGQSFGKFVGKVSVTGSGEPYLRLPRKLISFTSLNGSTHWTSSLAIRGSGWYLRSKYISGPPPVRADWDGWNEANAYYSGRVPIVAPYSRATTKFVENVEYEIDGVWGWNYVPAQVAEAAKLLVNDYACADNNYRDRFLTSMTAADWRIQFHDGAFSNTGNVRANQLLAEYVLHRGWVVI